MSEIGDVMFIHRRGGSDRVLDVVAGAELEELRECGRRARAIALRMAQRLVDSGERDRLYITEADVDEVLSEPDLWAFFGLDFEDRW